MGGRRSTVGRAGRGKLVARRSTPWGTIAAVAVVAVFAATVFGYAFLRDRANETQSAALAGFLPSASTPDPSRQIPGVSVTAYQGSQHVAPTAQVAYTQSPPSGGAHDGFWAACTGVVYDQPVRSENLVHSLEHGAVWIAYNPDQISGDALEQLAARVRDRTYTALSPYPGLDQPISLQSWGHQLKLADPADPRIDQFLTALRANSNTHPEVGASCQALGAGRFDQDAPPPFRPAPPVSAVGQPGVLAESGPTPGGAAGDAAPMGSGS